MTFKEYINNNYEELYEITRNITKNHKDTDDLFQFVILKLLENPPKKKIKDEQKKYFFIRVLKNNWYSNTSRFEYEFRRKVYDKRESKEYDTSLLEYSEEDYEELIPDIEWVREELNKLHWYSRDLFLLWLELGSVTSISKKTTIPINTCGKHIREIKEYLKELWELKKSY